jgi:CheY-like chemotaxis protein
VSEPPASSWPARVLVAEDHPTAARFLKLLFELEGCEAIVETSAARVVEAIASERPAVALIDVEMKPWAPLEVLRAIHDADLVERPALIAVSGHTESGIREQALELGAGAYLLKPYEPEDVVELAQRLVAARAATA